MSDDAIVRCALWENDLTRLRRARPSCGQYVLVEVLPEGLASRLAAAMAVEEREVQGRLERGCRAFAAWDWPDEVVSWLWVSMGEEWAPPLHQHFRFAEGDCYGWNAGTLEHHRGRGLFTGLLEHAGWQMAREGCHTMWNGILDGNLPSQRAHAAAGFRPVLRVTAINQPPPTRLFVRPADYADERLVERARRLLGKPTAAEARNGSAAAVLPAGRRG
jgi:GNAT superfamily N-acetyltransferase